MGAQMLDINIGVVYDKNIKCVLGLMLITKDVVLFVKLLDIQKIIFGPLCDNVWCSYVE